MNLGWGHRQSNPGQAEWLESNREGGSRRDCSSSEKDETSLWLLVEGVLWQKEGCFLVMTSRLLPWGKVTQQQMADMGEEGDQEMPGRKDLVLKYIKSEDLSSLLSRCVVDSIKSTNEL